MKNKKPRILLLEDDLDLQNLVSAYYSPRGYEIIPHTDPTVPLTQFQTERSPDRLYDIILTDLRMPNMDGMEFIRRMKLLAPKVPIILMTAHSSVEVAIEAIELGAYDFVVKPIHFPQLNISLERALKWKRVESDNEVLRTQVKSSHAFKGAIGKSASMIKVFDLAQRVSNSTATVLITGESGTGKEVVARSIHQNGNRKNGPFVAINCSAIPENLLESELFGYAKGAFTGAAEKKIGLFEEAEGGVLFLDEIGDLNLPLQAKLLRVIQERKIKRIGENAYRDINVRILAATHKNLATEVAEKKFREDLFFRLNVIPIHIAPLRERTDDIIPLVEHFITKYSVQNDSKARSITRAGMDHLLKLTWRGNVRELENAIERAVVLCDSREIGVKDLPAFEASALPRENIKSDSEYLMQTVSAERNLPSLDEFSLKYVALVLSRVGGVKEQAARILEIDRKTLYRRIDELEKRQATSNLASHSGAVSEFSRIPVGTGNQPNASL